MQYDLDATEYKGIIIGESFIYFDEFDGEPVEVLSPKSVFVIQRHYYQDLFLGWNIYVRTDYGNILLETKSTKTKAEKFLKKINFRRTLHDMG